MNSSKPASKHNQSQAQQSEQTDLNVDAWQMPDFNTAADQQPIKSIFVGAPETELECELEPPQEELEPLSIDQIEKIREAAYQEGFEEGREAGHQAGFTEGHKQGIENGTEFGKTEGLKQGIAEASEQIEALNQQLEKLLANLLLPCQQVDAEIQKHLMQLVIELTQQVILCEIKTNPEVLQKSLQQALSLLGQQDKQRHLYFSQNDFDSIKAWLPLHYPLEQWQVDVDPELTQGDFRIEQQQSLIEVDMQVRLQQFFEDFLRQNTEANSQVSKQSSSSELDPDFNQAAAKQTEMAQAEEPPTESQAFNNNNDSAENSEDRIEPSESDDNESL